MRSWILPLSLLGAKLCLKSEISVLHVERNHVKCYSSCSTGVCRASSNYSIDPTNVLANDQGTGPGVEDINFQNDHDNDICKVTSDNIVRHIARSHVCMGYMTYDTIGCHFAKIYVVIVF